MNTDTADLKPKIAIDDLSFFYGTTKSLKNISLPLYERKVTAFIGPSGCGKSTLLRAINRIYELYPNQHAEGTITLDGEDILKIKDLNLLRARIGMVFQKPTPFPMSIYDNVAFGIKLYERLPRSEMDGRVEDALTRAALWTEVKDKLHASGLSLSGGQQQRLCIARAIATEPAVLLMDEPCSALDPIATHRIEELMKELKKKYTIVIVTHNLQQAKRVADMTAFLYVDTTAGGRTGYLVEYEETKQIFENPREKPTRDYVAGAFS